MLKEFREFAMRGNVVDMAVGIILGGAFGTIAKSLVDDVIMPPLGLVLGGVDFSNLFVVLKDGVTAGPYASLADARAAGAVAVAFGVFVNNVVSFLIVALAVFFLVRGINSLRRSPQPPTPDAKECPYCCAAVPLRAIRCPECTSELAPA